MTQLSMTIRDSLFAKELEAVASMYGYTATIPDPADPTLTVPNPQTKEQFLKQQVKAWLRNQAVEHANRTALASVSVEANS